MKVLKFSGLLQSEGWISPAFVTLDDHGKTIDVSKKEPSGKVDEVIEGYAIPGFQNAHSHSFQYAMAGLAEIHPNPTLKDDFWSWRNTMYKIALSVDPDHLEAIATMLYAEMLKHGYTSVAEFHYLHHDKRGMLYANISEMGERLVAAAKKTGIKITLIPIFYQKGGFGKKPEVNQRRFISNTPDDYKKLLEASKASAKFYDRAHLGLGIHSLRAVDASAIKETITTQSNGQPIHFHVSEQLKEIEDCQSYLNARPVEWLLNNLDLDENFHLVHATHINEREVAGIAQCGAHVVLCPSTEGNLGDGLFPLKDFQKREGKWSIGTDSHVGISPLEEYRILDYGQRLISHSRNQFISNHEGNSGFFALDMSLKAGRKAMGDHEQHYFPKGVDFDAVIIDSNQPLINTSSMDQILSTLIYSGDSSFFLGTITQGNWIVKNQRHVNSGSIVKAFSNTIRGLGIRA